MDVNTQPAETSALQRFSLCFGLKITHYSLYGGSIRYAIEGSDDDLLRSGIVEPRHLPSGSVRACKRPPETSGIIKCSRLGSGNARVVIDAKSLVGIDRGFAGFMKGLLADTKLSLVRREIDL